MSKYEKDFIIKFANDISSALIKKINDRVKSNNFGDTVETIFGLRYKKDAFVISEYFDSTNLGLRAPRFGSRAPSADQVIFSDYNLKPLKGTEYQDLARFVADLIKKKTNDYFKTNTSSVIKTYSIQTSIYNEDGGSECRISFTGYVYPKYVKELDSW